MPSKVKVNFILCAIILAVAILFFSMHYYLKPSITGFVTGPPPVGDPSLVLNVTFDDSSDPWKDYSIYNHQFSAEGVVNRVDKQSCKWYGCLQSSEGYINSSTKFVLNDGFALDFWVNYRVKPSGSNSHGFFWIGSEADGEMKTCWENNLGFSCRLHRDSGGYFQVSAGAGTAAKSNQWYHYFIQYDGDNHVVWRNGVVLRNESAPHGNLAFSVGELMRIADARFGGSFDGYLDEFRLWNRSDFNSGDVLEFYTQKRKGTPPDLDIYVKSIKYTLPHNWAHSKNELVTGGNMDITFTIANAGIQNSNNFDYQLNLGEKSVCSGRVNVAAGGELNVTCSWATTEGFHQGNVLVDVQNEITEDNEVNNRQKVYVPFLNRPFVHFNLEEWEANLKPFSSNPSNEVAYDSYSWAQTFGCSPFNSGNGGNDVDPYGKKGRECAIGCLVNDYSGIQCNRALEHLMGWANRSSSSYTNVQAIHELFHVGVTYDILFPMLTSAQNNRISAQLHDICQQITSLGNTRPDLDDDSIIAGGNGPGFGAGMGGFCMSILGSHSENPTLIQELPQQYWGKNIPDEWADRQMRFLRAFKNDSWAKYQERISYKWYSQFHLVDNWFFEKKFGLSNLEDYQNAFCSMAREAVTETLDFTYNGDALRNNHDQNLRTVQAGDSHSFENIGSGSFVDFGILTFYGVLCDDPSTKEAILWLRNKIHQVGDGQNKYVDSYLYKQLYDEASGRATSPESVFPKVVFDNANDILTIRTNYTYTDDEVIQIDGGEEKGGGHSQAQGYYLYALGEPFLDYEQVPYEDDVRAETWKNGVSLQNAAQTSEGTSGTYSETCGSARLNQYYGMKDCSIPQYPSNYPNHRHFPLQYGGDLEDYVGTKNANFAGVYVWRPYKNADPVQEFFVKFGDLMAKRTIVSGNTEGKGIYHNFINIYDEFTETRDGTDLTFSRNGKNLDIDVVYSDAPFTLNGGDSGVRYCFFKTSCSGSKGGNGNYRRTYLHTASNDADFILAHHWYLNDQKQTITPLSGTDSGLQQGDNIIIFDTSNEGITSYGTKSTDGWAVAYNDNTKEIGTFNATTLTTDGFTLFTSSSPISIHLERTADVITVSANTMERNQYIDEPKQVSVTIDVRELTNNSGFTVRKEGVFVASSESGTTVTFTVETGQNGATYTIVGGSSGPSPPCTESWSCSSWSTCTNNIQTRTCTDLNNCGNLLPAGNTTKSCGAQSKSLRVSLDEGWNLVNNPYNLATPAVEDVFDPVSNDIDVVTAFDVEDGWDVYHFNSNIPSESFNITPGVAYRVKANKITSLMLNGVPANKTRTLTPGWHLVGLSLQENKSINMFLTKIRDKIGDLWSLESGSYQQHNADSVTTLETGKGIWIYVNESASLTG